LTLSVPDEVISETQTRRMH